MKLRIIAAVLLLLFLGLAILEARVLRTEYGRACDQYQSHCAQILGLDTRTAELQKKLESQNVMIHFDDALVPQNGGGEIADIGHV
jgi:hypothetical protein